MVTGGRGELTLYNFPLARMLTNWTGPVGFWWCSVRGAAPRVSAKHRIVDCGWRWGIQHLETVDPVRMLSHTTDCTAGFITRTWALTAVPIDYTDIVSAVY